ncbi:MAG TPA: maleylacetate reductase [Vicinamibacterales bacterium]|nr:maleylacetate reductase [Vicinamibacterales bacterium]
MFIVEWSRTRVVFGAGTIERLGTELDALGLARCLLVTTPRRDATIASVLAELGDRLAGVCDIAAMHVPSDRVQRALAEVDRIRPDVLIAVGGGSAVGLAKAIARERSLPIVAVPTTYAGSEMTSIWGITAGDTKTTGRDPAVAPRLVIYDPVLTLWLPPHTSAASGMNAMAHAVEAMYAPDASPMAAAVAEDAIRTLARALPSVLATPRDLDARTLALRGAHAAAMALELAPMGLHHKLCHVLGGFGLPHAETHAALLPYVVAFNAPAAPEAMARIAGALGTNDAASGLRALNDTLGLTMSLGTLGLKQSDAERAAGAVAAATFPNPRAATPDAVRQLLVDAL